MTTTRVNSNDGSNDIGEYLRAKFVDEFFFSLDAWPTIESNGNIATEFNSTISNSIENITNETDDIDDNNNNNNSNSDNSDAILYITNNNRMVDVLETEMRKLANSDLRFPPNVATIKQHDKFTGNKQHRPKQQQPKQLQQQQQNGQKKWPSKSPTTENAFCVFCKNNGEKEDVYTSHKVKDNRNRVCCPRLREYKCRICGEYGDNAHTIRYCPKREPSNL